MSLRLKILINYITTVYLGAWFLWSFSVFYVYRDYTQYFTRLSLFALIVTVLVMTVSVILAWRLRFLVHVERLQNMNQTPTEKMQNQADRGMDSLTRVFFLANIAGFFIGPVAQYFIRSLREGTPFISFNLLSAILFSVAIGLYVTVVQIRITDRILFTYKTRRAQYRIGKQRRSWAQRQYLVSLSLFTLCFSLFMAASFGYLEEELLAPGQLDGVSAASGTHDYRYESWAQAIEGNPPELTHQTPYIHSRIVEFYSKMFLLAGIILALGYLLVRLEQAPTSANIALINKNLQSLAKGEINMDQQLAITESDELGETVHWINTFLVRQKNLFDTVRNATDTINVMSHDLTEMGNRAVDIQNSLNRAASDVGQSVNQQNSAIEESSENVNQLVIEIEGADENLRSQSTAVEDSSAAIEEMTASIASVTRSSEEANQQTQDLQNRSQEGERVMKELNLEIQQIAEASDQVSASIHQVSKIAAQTNLLAMNAAIEAAHAGDLGRGFAVVASEVRNLAEDSSAAAKKITQMTKEMNSKAGSGLERSGEALSRFSHIREGVEKLAVINSSISSAMEEQRQGSQDIQSAMEKLLEQTREVLERMDSQRDQSSAVLANSQALSRAAGNIQEKMTEQQQSLRDFESFLKTLKDLVEQNASTVEQLKSVTS